MKVSKSLSVFVLGCLTFYTSACGGAPATETPPPTATPAPSVVEGTAPTLPPATETPGAAEKLAPSVVEVFTLTSPAFNDGEEMADRYTFEMLGQCSGENYSPALEWSGAPAGTRSFALTVIDPDGGDWVHWLQFNILPETTSLPEAIGGPDVGIKGKNDFGAPGYGGPCPPGGTHHYIFTLYALDASLDLPAGTRLKDLQSAMAGHILGQAQLTGLRTR